MTTRASLLARSAALAAVGATFSANAVIIDFNGGTAFFIGGGSAVVTNTGVVHQNVDYYLEDGIRVDFIGGAGIVGDYYGNYVRPDGSPLDNSVLHAHWDSSLTAVRFSKVDGSTLDLNYVDLSSNTIVGGGAATGAELSYITPLGGPATLLPSSDWGIEYLFDGAAGDGIERLFLNSSFDGILSFDVTSLNAFCFGLDNFYIDEPAPPVGVPEPSTLALFGIGLMALGLRRKRPS